MTQLFENNRTRLAALLLGVGVVTLIGTACGLFVNTTPNGPTQPAVVDSIELRRTAATRTAASGAGECAAIRPFYWQIGNSNGSIASGATVKVGTAITYAAQTEMPIASASKWLYAAYVAQRRVGTLTVEDIQFLTFRSGYTNFAAAGCDPNDTVTSCVARTTNGTLTPANVDKFFYDGAHMQKHASLPAPGMSLGAMGNVALATEMRSLLGTEINLAYTSPQLAGGARMSAADYATFLRKILKRQLNIATLLGTNATCTNLTSCSTAVSTPTPSNVRWDYSIGHWVENDPTTGDGSFSSPGAFGFYPWLNRERTLYGIVARFDTVTPGAHMASARCGALIRKAYVTATPQLQ